MQTYYVFPAVFTFYDDDNDEQIGVFFPDLPGCVSNADSHEQAIFMAREALGMHLSSMEDLDEEIPSPSDYLHVKESLEENQIVCPVDVYMPKFREAANNKAINRTVTLPTWLVHEAKDVNINLSQTLQDALMEKLGIQREIKRRKYKSKQ